jgi:hypothetical protein
MVGFRSGGFGSVQGIDCALHNAQNIGGQPIVVKQTFLRCSKF